MRDERFWQLKESAKWSLSLDEKRQAIEQLVNIYGKDALHTIEEIKDVTAYEEVRSACIEAIKSARTTGAPPTAASSEKGAAADQDKKNGNKDNAGAKTKAKSAGRKKSSRKAKRKNNNNHRHSQ